PHPVRVATRSASTTSIKRRTLAVVPAAWTSKRPPSIAPAFRSTSGGWITGPALVSAASSASTHGRAAGNRSASRAKVCLPREAGAALGGQHDRGVLRQRPEGRRAAAPEPNAVAGEREVGGGREAAVARAEDGDVHAIAPVAWSSAIFTFEYLSTRARISLVCSPSRGGGVISRPIAPSILTGVPSVCVLPWRG